ncbi:MAG: hypothetical protein R6V10_15030 [bacterium]
MPRWLPLLIILLAGLFFRLSTTLWEPQVYPDSMQYMHLAKEIRSGAFFSENFDLDQGFIKSRHLPPLYPFLISPFAGTQADLEKVGMSISLFLSLLALVFLYYGLAGAFTRRAAIIGTSIMAFHAFTLRYANPILTESTFTFFYAAVICISLYAMMKPAVWKFAVLGVLCSCAYTTRDVGLTAPVIVLAFALFKFGVMDRMPWKRTATLVLALLFVFLAFTAPYLAHIRVRTGSWGLTAQMSNTSLTRQVQLFGGDRFDRDRLPAQEKGTDLVGDEPAEGAADLLKLAPGLIKKTVFNMGSYGKELLKKWNPLIFILAVTGLFGAFFRYRREKDREQLFYTVYIAVWIVQLWALYSLITPYMVDSRYMYPLVVPGIMMAALGIEHASHSFRQSFSSSEPGNRTSVHVLVLILLILVVVFLAFLHLGVDSFTLKNFIREHQRSLGWVLVFYLTAPVIAFMLITGYGLRALPFSLARPAVAAGIGAGLIVLGALLAGVSDRTPVFYEFLRENSLTTRNAGDLFKQLFFPYLPAVLFIGGGLGFLAFAAGKVGGLLSLRFSVWFPVFLLAAVFFCQYPNLYSVVLEADNDVRSMAVKYASGHKEAAAAIKDRVPSGQIIASRKPFIAYYLDGKWYRDQEGQPIPKTVPEVQELINQDKIDYIAADSHTFRALRPALIELALGLSDIENARIIYSRFFSDYRRIITIYECGRKKAETPRRGSVRAHIQKAGEFLQEQNYPFAMRELQRAIEYDNDNETARKTMVQLLERYYGLARRNRVPTLLTAPHLMQRLLNAYENYTSINPDDRQARQRYQELKRTYEAEKARLEKAGKPTPDSRP